ncbi:hypothetical protein [Streptomyces sp.]|uniref:WD40 repeat domain-containing protein n=1 Tax=Streptomyces sp. TaxID=1931 RepID=UPI0034544F10
MLLGDPVTGLPRHRLDGDGSAVWSVALFPDGRSLVAVTMDGSALLWDTATGAEVCRLRVDNHLSSCSFDPRGDRVVLGGAAGIYLCEVRRRAVRGPRRPGPSRRSDRSAGNRGRGGSSGWT